MAQKLRILTRINCLCLGRGALWISAALVLIATSESLAGELLVVDRLSNSVYRYSASGTLLGTVIDRSLDIYQPTGIGMSPDFTELYVSSSQRNHVMKYDYDPATGVASNPTIFADMADGLAFPNDIQFSPDGNKIYVANLNGGVSQFNVDGSSAGPKLFLPTDNEEVATPTSSMNFTSDGRLLAGAFQNSTGVLGGIAISDSGVTSFPNYLVDPVTEIRGATGLMVHDNYLYVSGLFSGRIQRFDLSDCDGQPCGQMDASWGILGVAFPQDLVAAPDGSGFLLGVLGLSPGAGNISRYAFDGTLLGTFATPGGGGFTEATAFVVVPTSPAGLVGDFNHDGKVDAADYVVWRKTSPLDESGYNDWRTNFSMSAAASSAGFGGGGTVPEPAGGLLMLVAILVSSSVRYRN